MSYFLDEPTMREWNAKLLAHLPLGPMRVSFSTEPNPVRTFEALVAYYAAQEVAREDIRALFYAMEAGESWCQAQDGPTSGQLAEQVGEVEVPALPDDLVATCRTKFMPQVQEHSKAEDLDPEKFLQVLDELGIGPNEGEPTQDDFDPAD